MSLYFENFWKILVSFFFKFILTQLLRGNAYAPKFKQKSTQKIVKIYKEYFSLCFK